MQQFGKENVNAISYDHCLKQPQGIFKYFLKALNLPFTDDFVLPEEHNSNFSLPSKVILHLTRFNKLPLTQKQHQLAIRLLLNEFPKEQNRPLLTLDDRKRLWRRYKGINEFVSATYGAEPFCEPDEETYNFGDCLDFCNDFDLDAHTKIIDLLKVEETD
jgi:hypothetical protein